MKSLTVLILFCLSFSALADKKKLGKNIIGQLKNDKLAASGQKTVNTVDDQRQKMFEEYRMTLRKIESTKAYNKQLVDLMKSQDKEKISLAKQIDSIKDTNKDIVPLMISMVETIEKMVAIDTPFLAEERAQRVDNLKKMMKRADVTTSEKYRRILEAYQIENEYGKTIEAYRGKLPERDLTVDFLRVGRLMLVYQTLDAKEQGVWDKTQKKFVAVDSDFKKSIREGLRMARKQTAPNLITLPVVKEAL
jgi:hypothetical protein